MSHWKRQVIMIELSSNFYGWYNILTKDALDDSPVEPFAAYFWQTVIPDNCWMIVVIVAEVLIRSL